MCRHARSRSKISRNFGSARCAQGVHRLLYKSANKARRGRISRGYVERRSVCRICSSCPEFSQLLRARFDDGSSTIVPREAGFDDRSIISARGFVEKVMKFTFCTNVSHSDAEERAPRATSTSNYLIFIGAR